MYDSMYATANSNSFYQGDEYDAAFLKATSAATEEEQWEGYKECDEILARDLPVSVILHSMSSYLFDDTIMKALYTVVVTLYLLTSKHFNKMMQVKSQRRLVYC